MLRHFQILLNLRMVFKMKHGFIKVGAVSPRVKLADPMRNAATLIEAARSAASSGVKLLVFPELFVSGYTCGDLFLQKTLLDAVEAAITRIVSALSDCDIVCVFGAPIRHIGKLYNCAVVTAGGRVLGIVPKSHMPNYAEFYELRHFSTPFNGINGSTCEKFGCSFGTNLLFACREMPEFVLGVEICEDLWVVDSPSNELTKMGATVIANCSAGDETIGKAEYRRTLISAQSAKTISGYIYCNAGEGESTTDMVFSGHSLIYENGRLLAQRNPFEQGIIISEFDLQQLVFDRRRLNCFTASAQPGNIVYFNMHTCDTQLTRKVSRNPFVPSCDAEINNRMRSIIRIQAAGLMRRAEHINAKSLVVGVSGGLDSCLALIAACVTADLMGKPKEYVHAITMPCFGTTSHTRNNAIELCEALGVRLEIIPIENTVKSHFADIGHDEHSRNVVYENAQARVRTLILMDIANEENGLVVGTGDLSELALGWATYNGDHMSMYGVNAGIPKTLIKFLVKHYAEASDNARLQSVLNDILDTPISPELLPADNESITQITEDLVGPYELHDFFLYYVLRWGFLPEKIYRLARYAFEGTFDDITIKKWLKVFYRRFFSQQFKRSCMPDAPKIGSVCLSPRGDWRMPSDACGSAWLEQLAELQ